MQVMWAIGGNSGCSRSLVSHKAVHAGCHGFGVRDKAVSSVVERRELPVHPVRIAPHDDIPPRTHSLVEDSKTLANWNLCFLA